MASISVAGDSSGSITIAAPAVAGSGTLTLPVATDTLAGIAATQTLTNKTLTSPTITGATITVAATAAPAFSAYMGSALSYSSNTNTKLPMNTEEWDTASAFDSTTNYRFTPLVAGYYQVNICVQTNTSQNYVWAFMYKNGTIYKTGTAITTQGTAALSVRGTVNAIVYLNGSTDYIESYGYFGNGGAGTTMTGLEYCYFQAAMVRSA